ncbi:DUF6545 domain-containing protein [Nocardia yamanashiensis]|uniref:DUF6545 domain-containing protein n=1 Tax=Nocardia yamanashiensis TaxID=209247 RepID=UPI00082DB633|nr:hypothetical protein [Nocardia yamanashiensis]
MIAFDSAVAVLILAGAAALVRQRLMQGVRGRWNPVAVLTLLALSFLLQTPVVAEALAGIRTNIGYLAAHLCALIAIMVTTLHWRCYLSPDPPGRWRLLVINAFYVSVLAVLIYLFMTSRQRPHGIGFAREFAGSTRMQAYWIVQAMVVIPVVSTLAVVAAKATAQERRWRRTLFGLLVGSALAFTVYEAWVVVVVIDWPAMPPAWAQRVTLGLQVTTSSLLVGGTIGPVVLGSVRSARLAYFYIEELAPLHHWLTSRYPQVRFRGDRIRRAETRVTDMLVEISDGLRLLQREDPALACEKLLDDETIIAALDDGAHHIAYELAAARSFRAAGRRVPADR